MNSEMCDVFNALGVVLNEPTSVEIQQSASVVASVALQPTPQSQCNREMNSSSSAATIMLKEKKMIMDKINELQQMLSKYDKILELYNEIDVVVNRKPVVNKPLNIKSQQSMSDNLTLLMGDDLNDWDALNLALASGYSVRQVSGFLCASPYTKRVGVGVYKLNEKGLERVQNTLKNR